MENPNLLDIDGYDNYKFDTNLQKVYNNRTNMYLKNSLDKGIYRVNLYKNGKVKKYSIHHLSNICNNVIENNNLVDIPNYDNYKFDKVLLQVYNIKTNVYLKNSLNNGYYRVSLSKNGKVTTYRIHQLVYIINNPNEDLTGFEIDHIDRNSLNNNISNLRKCTRSDNQSNRTYITNKLGIKYITQTEYGYTFQLTKNKISYRKTFKTIEEAIEHRDRFVLEKCGEFTNLG